MDLTEAEEIKKRWQEYTEELYKKDLHDPDNHDAVKVLHSTCHQIWKTQHWPQDQKRSVFIPMRKKRGVKECSNYCPTALISHTSKVMLKILQARLQQYVKRDLLHVQAGYRKGRETDQIAMIVGSLKKQSSRKTSTSALLISPKPLTVQITTNWKILKEMAIPYHLTCIL